MGKEITDRDILNQMIDRGVKNIIECYYPQFSFLSGYASNLLMDFIDPYLEVLNLMSLVLKYVAILVIIFYL